MCQQCVDDERLSQETFDKIEAFNRQWPFAAYGPAHIVLDDDNVFAHNLDWCIGITQAAISGDLSPLNEEDQRFMLGVVDVYATHERAELNATLDFLRELREVPEIDR